MFSNGETPNKWKFLRAISVSVLVSSVLLLLTPVMVIFFLIFFAALPYIGLQLSQQYMGFILLLSLLIVIIGPGIWVNLLLTKHQPITYRIGSIAVFLVAILGVWFLISGFVLDHLSPLAG